MRPSLPPAPRNRARTILPAALALTGCAALLWPTQTQAFTTLGSWLPMQSHRDVRVCPNFTDPTVLDNTTPDPNFPGYVGVELAIWKACVEWSSLPHGDGSGDPHQPGGLGSGGANFDIAWLGLASSPGSFDNTHAQINGNGSGVYAFTQFNGVGNGWIILYYSEPWVWEDGPGDLPGGRTDMQGIATHEYGHALGLGHSSAGGATMRASTSESNSINLRSINSDDIAGVRAIYGVAASDKPVIASIAQPAPGLLEITGANFDATGNEVWFSRGAPSTPAQGVPIKAFGVPSSAGGTVISVAVPDGAGSGAVLVRRPGDGGDDLSNAWPYDHSLSSCDWETFCVASPNSVGSGALIGGLGSTRIADDAFALNVSGLPPGTIGIFFVGTSTGPGIPFGNGVVCVTGQVQRFGATFADQLGLVTRALPFGGFPGNQMAADGTPWSFQFWYRNQAGGGAGFNTSNGLTARWCP
jgi:hypothetical protein